MPIRGLTIDSYSNLLPLCLIFAPESDVDVLVEFEPGKAPGLKFITMQDELSEIYGRKVDLHTYKGVESNPNWLLRKEILSSAEAVYEQA